MRFRSAGFTLFPYRVSAGAERKVQNAAFPISHREDNLIPAGRPPALTEYTSVDFIQPETGERTNGAI